MTDATDSPLIAHINLARGYRGGERQTELLVRELAGHGVRQRLIARAGEPLIVRLADLAGVERAAVGGVFGAARAARGAALVHVHEGRGIQGAALARLADGPPYVVTRRVMRPLKDFWLTRRMYAQAAHLVAISRHIERQLNAYVPGQVTSVIPSAATPMQPDPTRVAALKKRWGSGPVVGHIGALIADQKGQPLLLEAARARPALRFVLVGSGADEQALKQSATGLDNVVFTGQVEDVASHLAAFDLFAFPSLFEGLGSILIDAMALGLPIVATRVGGIPDLIDDGSNGLLIEPQDLDGLLAALDRLTEDADLCRRFAAENARRARRYQPAAMAAEYRRVYGEILG